MKYLFGFMLGFMACSATYGGRYLIPGYGPKTVCKHALILPDGSSGKLVCAAEGFNLSGLRIGHGELVFFPGGERD